LFHVKYYFSCSFHGESKFTSFSPFALYPNPATAGNLQRTNNKYSGYQGIYFASSPTPLLLQEKGTGVEVVGFNPYRIATRVFMDPSKWDEAEPLSVLWIEHKQPEFKDPPDLS